MRVKNEIPTSRAATVAAEQGFGAFRSSHRVNRANDRNMKIAVLMLPIAAGAFLWGAWQASPWGGSPDSSDLSGMIASGVAGLVFLAMTVWLTVPMVIALVRVRGAKVWIFERGAIAERPGGHLYSWPFIRATARYVCWDEPWEGEIRDHVQLWVTFHVDGETICFDGRDPADEAGLPALARALGATVGPERIGRLTSDKAPTPF